MSLLLALSCHTLKLITIISRNGESYQYNKNKNHFFFRHKVFGLGIFGTSVMAVLTPIVCYQGIYYLFAIRVLQGIFSGLSFPSVNDIYAKWSPPMERSRMSGFGISGCFAGAVVAMILSGWLAVNFGWESIFYVFGVLGIIWSIIWFIVVKDCPEKDKCMSENEREFIRNSLKQHGVTNVINPPWKSIFTSMPVYAIVVTHFSYTWGFYTMLTQLPSYMNDMLDFNLQDAGFVSAIPYLALSSLLFISGYLADWLQMNNFLSTTQVRKYFNNLSLFAQMIFLLLAAYFKDPVSIIVCITLSVGLGAFSVSGYLPNPLDIAPQFASIIIGISNTIATIPGLVSPVLTGYIVQTPVNNYLFYFLFQLFLNQNDFLERKRISNSFLHCKWNLFDRNIFLRNLCQRKTSSLGHSTI